MSYFDAFIYGLIQGLTEFLPVSSSGHLALLPHFLKLEDPGVFFDLTMHVGTALSVIVYFKKELLNLMFQLKSPFQSAYAFNFLVATLTSVVFILLLKPFSESMRAPLFIAINLSVFGLLLGLSSLVKVRDDLSLFRHKDLKRSLLVGATQAFAIFPGVSRSGITMTSLMFSRVGLLESARFSFLLSLPIILASFAYKSLSLIKSSDAQYFSWSLALFGCFISFIIGLLTIHYFLKLLRILGPWFYAVYRCILALLIYFYVV